MPPQPGFFHCRQVQRIGVQIARQLRAPAALNAIDDLDRQLANSLIQRIAQRSLRGNGIQTQFARIDRRGDLIDLSLLQLAEKKAGAGFIRHHIVVLLIQQSIERLQVAAVGFPAMTPHEVRSDLLQRADADGDARILRVEHHRTSVLTAAVDAQRRTVPGARGVKPGGQRLLRQTKRQVGFALTQRIQQRSAVGIA